MADFSKAKALANSLASIAFIVNIVVNIVQINAVGNIPSCSKLGASCLDCELNDACEYGKDIMVKCKAMANCACQVSLHLARITITY